VGVVHRAIGAASLCLLTALIGASLLFGAKTDTRTQREATSITAPILPPGTTTRLVPTTATTTPIQITTTVTTRPRSDVRTLVVNAGAAAGSAARATESLRAGGWSPLPPRDAPQRRATSQVLTTAATRDIGIEIASALGIAQIVPAESDDPVWRAFVDQRLEVLVVLGPNS
jgi:hypothetical protein